MTDPDALDQCLSGTDFGLGTHLCFDVDVTMLDLAAREVIRDDPVVCDVISQDGGSGRDSGNFDTSFLSVDYFFSQDPVFCDIFWVKDMFDWPSPSHVSPEVTPNSDSVSSGFVRPCQGPCVGNVIKL